MSSGETLPAICPVTLNALRVGLTLLLDTDRYAGYLGISGTDVAVKIAELQRAGMSNSDLRWLGGADYLRHLQETTEPGRAGRSFLPAGPFVLSDRSCFVLTTRGRRFAKELLATRVSSVLLSCPRLAQRVLANLPARPHWDADRRELRARHLVVKHFHRPAPAQEIVLAAFQEEGWPAYIDDPLPPRGGADRWERLHNTINRLNGRQTIQLIEFHGDGTGQRIGWKWRRGAEPTCLLFDEPKN